MTMIKVITINIQFLAEGCRLAFQCLWLNSAPLGIEQPWSMVLKLAFSLITNSSQHLLNVASDKNICSTVFSSEKHILLGDMLQLTEALQGNIMFSSETAANKITTQK